MTTPSTTLAHAIEVLGCILTQTSESCQRLLNTPKSIYLCREAGLSLRHLADCYSKVLLAELGHHPESNDNKEYCDDQGDAYFEEEAGN